MFQTDFNSSLLLIVLIQFSFTIVSIVMINSFFLTLEHFSNFTSVSFVGINSAWLASENISDGVEISEAGKAEQKIAATRMNRSPMIKQNLLFLF